MATRDARSRRASRAPARSPAHIEQVPQPRSLLGPRWAPLAATLGMAATALLPRVHGSPRVLAAVLIAAGLLVVAQVALHLRSVRSRRTLSLRWLPQPVHYV